jgi:hypothetical protein
MGLLEKKFDKLLVLAARFTSCDPATADNIQISDVKAIGVYSRVWEAWIDDVLKAVLRVCANRLANETWRDLAKRPADFNKALDKLMRGTTTAMKLLYRIPDHRPSANLERDRTLFQLKSEHPKWSFGQLANHYNRLHPNNKISVNHAERCCKQETERLRRKMLRALKARGVHLKTKYYRSVDKITNEPPSVQYILAILTDTD